jgi:hypothetical protein
MNSKKGKTTTDWLNELVRKYQLPNEADGKPRRMLTEKQLKIIKLKDVDER